MDWFTADLHLGHKNIVNYCNRPFTSIDEHDKTLIENLNSFVKEKDNLYFIGDIFWRDSEEYLKQIRCENIHFVIGSHDKASATHGVRDYFKSYGHKLVIDVGETSIIMSHYPMLTWDRSHYGTIHLFGHHHGLLGNGINKCSQAVRLLLSKAKMMDVGVDTNNYYPYSTGQILATMSSKEGLFRIKGGEIR